MLKRWRKAENPEVRLNIAPGTRPFPLAASISDVLLNIAYWAARVASEPKAFADMERRNEYVFKSRVWYEDYVDTVLMPRDYMEQEVETQYVVDRLIDYVRAQGRAPYNTDLTDVFAALPEETWEAWLTQAGAVAQDLA